MNPEAGGARADVRSGGAEPGLPRLGRPTMTDVAAAAGRQPEDGLARGQRRATRHPRDGGAGSCGDRASWAFAATTSRALRRGQRFWMLGLVIEDVANPFYSRAASRKQHARGGNL